ncbi:hypothetical protein QBC45DRAFT_464674 [Copromyces sp. CBS 386.78]|nr:hypothetical protein QBC45DRAFT_464674 [Copromyces sp. CBS 386.78]
MADLNTIDIAAVYGFTEHMESAARQKNPDLKNMWKLILFLQNGLCDPITKAVRPFSYFTIPAAYQQFGKNAYDWLVLHYYCRTTETALGEIGHTRPDFKKALLDGLAPHEKDQKLRRTRGLPPTSRVLPGYSTSLPEFYATEGALKTLTYRTVSPTSTADIPHTRRQQLKHVKKMAKALANTDGIVDNDSHQVATIKRTSREVFEHVSWRLWDTAIKMQKGRPAVLPWSTGFYWRKFATMKERWDAMVRFTKKSKAAVANLLHTPYWNWFAANPNSELKKKKTNKHGNNRKKTKNGEDVVDDDSDDQDSDADNDGTDNGDDNEDDDSETDGSDDDVDQSEDDSIFVPDEENDNNALNDQGDESEAPDNSNLEGEGEDNAILDVTPVRQSGQRPRVVLGTPLTLTPPAIQAAGSAS